jgi:hypothetical protein
MRHIRDTFDCIMPHPEYVFTIRSISLSLQPTTTQVTLRRLPDNLFPHPANLKVLGGTLSHLRIALFPNEFVPPLLYRSTFLGFNLLLSFLWSRYSYDVTEHRSVKCL